MKGTHLLLCFVILMQFASCSFLAREDINKKDIEDAIKLLEQKLKSHLSQKDKKFIFPFQWQQTKGLYESSVRFNYIDKTNSEAAELFRSKIFRVPDSNMFVTSFVLYGLLEAA